MSGKKVCALKTNQIYPVHIYLFKVNNKNARKSCATCSKLTIKIPEQRYRRRSGVFIGNFEHISHWCCSGVFIVNFEHFRPSSSVSIADSKKCLLVMYCENQKK